MFLSHSARHPKLTPSETLAADRVNVSFGFDLLWRIHGALASYVLRRRLERLLSCPSLWPWQILCLSWNRAVRYMALASFNAQRCGAFDAKLSSFGFGSHRAVSLLLGCQTYVTCHQSKQPPCGRTFRVLVLGGIR